jgi:hypothetical protein
MMTRHLATTAVLALALAAAVAPAASAASAAALARPAAVSCTGGCPAAGLATTPIGGDDAGWQ